MKSGIRKRKMVNDKSFPSILARCFGKKPKYKQSNDKIITPTKDLKKKNTDSPITSSETNNFKMTKFSQIGQSSSSAKEKEEKPKFESEIQTKPMGFKNPKGYCYLNSVIQVLASCEDFKRDIEKSNWKPTDNTDDSIFVKGLFNLIQALQNSDENLLNESLEIVQQHITESSFGDDVYKCFMNLLSRVSKVVKTNIERPEELVSHDENVTNKSIKNFLKFKNRNPGFVFDNFYGQLTFKMICNVCNQLCNESFQVMKSLPLPVSKSHNPVTLESCVDSFFSDSKVEMDEPVKCQCQNGSKNMSSTTKLTHGPKYLFIYLNRGSYSENGEKNKTNVTCNENSINIKDSTTKPIQYKLISVIDHIGNSFGGHYYCTCSFEQNQWWCLNDSQVTQHSGAVVNVNTIVFLFKRQN